MNSRYSFMKHADLVVAAAIVFLVIMMVIPLPAALLDILLAFNLTFALVILLVTMFVQEPLEISVFPSLLLITTLFRLALNVSSTRLILLYGYAGEVIQAFGRFVVGGNPIVGFIIFCILVVIQFVVITRGAERVAEVAARFTLDAMPGKQMSIDADLNAGLITEDEARMRRREIEREADFYGAMDGASKFVKGDAVAGLIITVIDILGGLIIGMLQGGYSFQEALQRYSLLTVGDGLVSQIPALLISTATGIIVTRAASQENLGRDLLVQLMSQPRVLGITSGMMFFLGLIPGLPTIPFFALGGLVGAAAYALRGSAQLRPQPPPKRAAPSPGVIAREEVMPLVKVEPLEVELGYNLVPLADPEQKGDLLERIAMIRRQLAAELGLIIPPVRVRDNVQLDPGKYVIKLKGTSVGQGELFPGHVLVMGLGDELNRVQGIRTREPAFGAEAVWVPFSQRVELQASGFTVVEPSSVLATHLVEVIRRHAHELLTRQGTKELLDALRETDAALVDEVVPGVLSIGDVQRVLQNLLREGLPIKDMSTLLETLGDYGRLTKNHEVLTEYARQALSRVITEKVAPGGKLSAITLDPKVDELIASSVHQTEHGSFLQLEPSRVQALVNGIAAQVRGALERGFDPVILCSPNVRLHVRRLVEQINPKIIVVSYAELQPSTRLEAIGVVKLDAA